MRDLIKTNIDFSEIWREISTELNSDNVEVCIFADHCEGNYRTIKFDASEEAVLIAVAKFINAHTGLRTMRLMRLGMYDEHTSKAILDLRKRERIVNVSCTNPKAKEALSLIRLQITEQRNQWLNEYQQKMFDKFTKVLRQDFDEYFLKWEDDDTYTTLRSLLEDLSMCVFDSFAAELIRYGKDSLIGRWFKEFDNLVNLCNSTDIDSDSLCYPQIVGSMMLIAIFMYTILNQDWAYSLKIKGLALLCSTKVHDIDAKVPGTTGIYRPWDSEEIVSFWEWACGYSAMRGEE